MQEIVFVHELTIHEFYPGITMSDHGREWSGVTDKWEDLGILARLEADIAVINGKVIEKFSMPFHRDVFFETIIMPGFSDAHAHPQVIDAGLVPGQVWGNSYEWLMSRRLHVDEALIRNDIGLASTLTELVLKRVLLEGVTLIALTGRLEANIKAVVKGSVAPRVVLLPTVMSKRGWSRPEEIDKLFYKYRMYINDALLRPGVFVHSISYASPQMIYSSLDIARKMRAPLGMHLSEGISEKKDFLELLGDKVSNQRVVAVHCINDDYFDLGVRCASCPVSNMILYNRTRDSLFGVTSFGSDWPHLVGSIPLHIPLFLKLFNNDFSGVLYRATTGGYNDYGVPMQGDFVAYDVPLRKVLLEGAFPKAVSVASRLMVWEGVLTSTGERYGDIIRDSYEVIKYAVEVYGDGVMPLFPSLTEVFRMVENTPSS